MSTRPVRALSLAGLGAAVAAPALGAALLGSAASAAPQPATAELVGRTLVFTAAPGVDDDVIIGGTQDGTLEFFGVTGTGVDYLNCPSDGCDIVKVKKLVVYLRDGRDAAYADIPWNIPAVPFTIYGGPGRDAISGNAGFDDKLFGQGGDDWIKGYSGDDLLAGGRGDDQLRGNRGDDVVVGGPGNDVGLGGKGADQVYGGDGADRLFAGAGADTLVGGLGPDFLFSQDAFRDYVYTGGGRDTVKADAQDVVAE